MRHADQVAYLERMLTMVRTNTRDDGPGVSHTSVEEYYDPERYQREVALLFRKLPIVVAYSGQLRRAGDFVVHNDTGQPVLVVRGTDGVLRAFLNVCRHRSASVELKTLRRQQTRLRLPLSRLELRSHRPVDRHHRRCRFRRRRSQPAQPAPARRGGKVRAGVGGADGTGGGRGGRPRHRSLSRPVAGRSVRLGHAGLGAAQFPADPAAHELEAGDRHLPRALPLPLSPSRQRLSAVPGQYRHLRAPRSPHTDVGPPSAP